MKFQSPFLVIVPITSFLLLILVGGGPVNSAFSQNSDQERITIGLLPDSSPRFYECGTTFTNGSSSLNGLNPEESAQNVLTDRNSDTAIMGDARFMVNFSEPLINIPGPELRVTELQGAESFDVFNGENSITPSLQPVNETNGCDYSLNEALIDLKEFGIPEGSSVSSISIDNRGVEDTLFGADIGDISIIEASGNNTSMPLEASGNNTSMPLEASGNNTSISSSDTQTIMLGGQSLPENDYIPLYDSTPYEIMTGHIVANIPCDDDNATDVNVIIGKSPNLVPAKLEFVNPVFASEDLCVYQTEIASNDTSPITDIAIQNGSSDDIDFPETSSIIITVGLSPE